MTKTEQQKRFEAAWLAKWPNDEPRIFDQNSKGQYAWLEVQDTFEGFALGEASALERSAAGDQAGQYPVTFNTGGNATTGGENEK
jgi:hypothetical protein